MLSDLRLALRGVLRRPGFALAAVLTLALGIGANAAVFSVVRAVLLRPLPYAEPDRVVMVWNHWTNWPQTWLSEPEAADYARGTSIFERFAAFDDGAVNLTGGDGEPERVRAGLLSAAVLPALGVAPALGRNFTADEDRPDGPAVVVIGAAVWRRRFGADPDVVGKPLLVNGRAREVVGVMPAGFRLPVDFADARADVYLPLALGPADPTSRGGHYLQAVARLAPGLTLASAQARLDDLVERMKRDHPNFYGAAFGATLVPVAEQVFGAVRPALTLVSVAVAFLLLLACVNVASLLLMRAEARHREMAIRRAIGAGLGDLARLGVAESFVLSVLGGLAGLGLAAWAVDLLPRLAPESLPRAGDIRIDGAVLLFTAGTCVVTALLCGLWPVWRAGTADPAPWLGEGARGSVGRGAARFRRAVIALELGLAVLLTVGAGLLMRGFARLASFERGFASGGVLTFRLSAPAASYRSSSAVIDLVTGVLAEARALPGVEAAGATNMLPLAQAPGDWGFQILGRPSDGPDGGFVAADWMIATPGYAGALRIPVVRGRWLDDRDGRGAPGVVVINEATARTHWPAGNALGAQIRLGGGADTMARTVVGIVADVRQNSLDQAPRTQMYLPHAQFPSAPPDSAGAAYRGMSVAVRTTRAPEALIPDVRRIVRRTDPNIPLAVVRTMDDVVAASTATPRFALALVAAFAVLALLIAGVGVYGVVAYVVALRTREIGVRVALGARRSDVLRLVIGLGLAPAAAGIALGVVAALLGGGIVRSLLYGVPATDAGSFAAATALLALVGFVACYLPARRAARVDPMEALRTE
jgi:predicted permease